MHDGQLNEAITINGIVERFLDLDARDHTSALIHLVDSVSPSTALPLCVCGCGCAGEGWSVCVCVSDVYVHARPDLVDTLDAVPGLA